MYIRIINCSDETYWYNEHVGKVCKVLFIDEPTSAYVIDNIDGTGDTLGSVFPGDFEEVTEFLDEELFIPPEPPKTEEQLKYEQLQNELEITQNALNDMIMMNMLGGN